LNDSGTSKERGKDFGLLTATMRQSFPVADAPAFVHQEASLHSRQGFHFPIGFCARGAVT